MKNTFFTFLKNFEFTIRMKQIVIFVACVAIVNIAYANPEHPVVTNGTASITKTDNTTTINQTSTKAIIEWNKFNIDPHEKTQFIQPSTSSTALNRINSANGSSRILGTLTANGKIILINQSGFYFGPNAHVDVGGIVASTADMSNDYFLNHDNYLFTNSGNGSIINEGTIKAADYGLIALIGNSIANTGLIQAKLGSIVLASGNAFTLDFYGDQLINFAVNDKASVTGKVDNTGTLLADGGKILVSAKTAQNVLDNTINMQGLVQAKSVSESNGEIILSSNASINLAGTFDASGKTGGLIKVLGNYIHLASNTVLNANGNNGGGTILVGGNTYGAGPEPNALQTIVDAGALLTANANNYGNGGKVIVWSDNATLFHGTISVLGGSVSGNGGFAETSGHYLSIAKARVYLSAPHGTGGTWLLDPADVTIAMGTSNDVLNNGVYEPTSGSSTSYVDYLDLQTALAYGNITVTTTNSGSSGSGFGDIQVSHTLTWSSPYTLTLNAANNIFINSNITAVSGGLNLIAANGAQSITSGTIGSGTIGGAVGTLTASIIVNNFILTQGQWFQSATSLPTFTVYGNFKISESSPVYNDTYNAQFTRINTTSGNGISDVFGLQGIATGPSMTNYNLTNNIDASTTRKWGTTGFVPLGNINSYIYFMGAFDGNNYIIDKLFMNSPRGYVGLFGIAANSTIKNFGLTNVDITATSNAGVGGIAAQIGNTTIDNVFVTGSIKGKQTVGGLVGSVFGNASITNSYNAANITAVGADSLWVGGVAGMMALNTSISNSYNIGSVTSYGNTSDNRVGGLVGDFNANVFTGGTNTITNSYNSGLITATSGLIGGLVGAIGGVATIQNSFWDTNTSGISSSTQGCGNVGSCSGVTGVTTSAMMAASTFSSWGANLATTSSATPSSAIWFMVPGNTRPMLILEGFVSNVPRPIYTGHQLQLMSANLSGTYTLGYNVDLASSITNPSDVWGSNTAGSGSGFYPVGNNSTTFSGTLDGQNYTINHLYINRPNTDYIGLFGKVSNNITNVGVINANVIGFDNVGILIGNLTSGTISDTYTTGNVASTNGNWPYYGAGGLIGSTDGGTVTTSYSSANVSGPLYIGGLIGQINNTIVSYSYSTGDVTAKYTSYAGGFIGAAGLTATSNIINSYSTGRVNAPGTNTIGGFVGGTNLATITNSFWDTATSGMSVGNGGGSNSGLTGGIFNGTSSGSLAAYSTYTGADWSTSSGVAGSITSFDSYSSTPANYTWFIFDGYTRPLLLMEYNTLISNAHQLQLMGAASGGTYTLANSIDLKSGMTNAADVWGTNKTIATGRGFMPLDDFQGFLNGANHVIDNLYINRIAGESYSGLFGRLYGTLVNIGVTNADLNASETSGVLVGNLIGAIGNSYATGTAYFTQGLNGGLVGSISSDATLSNSYADVDITTPSTNTSSYVGGLVGISFGSINTSYSLGDVSLVNGNYVGGLIGYNGSSTLYSYSTGSVTSSGANTGGFAGYVDGSITQSFWDASTSGKTNGYGAYGSGTVSLYGGCFGSCALSISNATNTSPVDLSAASTYSSSNWDISSTVSSSKPTSAWFIFDGATRPLLMMEHSTTITNAHQLQLMGAAINNGYTLANDINLDNSFTNASDIWGTNYATNTGAGFNPIANNSTPFTGIFEGNSHVLNNLYIKTTQTTAGLFGSLSYSNIYNLSITNANITYVGNTDANIGILAGETYNVGNITRIFTSGTVNSGTATNNNIGGLFGYMNKAKLSNSYNAATINSTGTDNGYSNNVGGIAGTVTNGSVITNSYNIGTINGSSFAGDKVGGLIGNYTSGGNSIITNTYNTGLTSGGGTRGGLIGYSDSGTSNVIIKSFWDTETSGNNFGIGFGDAGTGGTITAGTFNGHSGANLSSLATFSGANWSVTASSSNLPNNAVWFISEGNTRPVLISELFNNNQTTAIYTSHQLQLINAAVSGRYTLGSNVDLSSTYNTSTAAATAFSKADIWGGSATGAGLGFAPIGSSGSQFTGSFDGQGYTASNLYINRSAENIGLFGYVNSLYTIKNVGVTDANVTGTYNVGALIGYANGDIYISHTYSTGATNSTVIQSFSGVGGLVGRIDGAIIDSSFSLATVTGAGDAGGLIGDLTNGNSGVYRSFSAGNVIGTQSTGGLAGLNYNFSNIYNSYSYSKVTSTGVAGGLVGNNTNAAITNSFSTGFVNGDTSEGGLIGLYSSGTITNSFWNTLTSGLSTSQGSSGTPGYQGMTTTEMMTLSNFQSGSSFLSSGEWNITAASSGIANTYGMIDGSSYPYLTAFYAALPRVISGTTNASTSATVNLTTDGSLISEGAGSYGNAVSYGTTSIGNNGFYYFLQSASAITDGDSIFAYLTGGATGNAITSAATSTASVTGFTLNTNQISVGDSNTSSVSNSLLISAAANISSGNLLYSGTGSNLTINNNINFAVGNSSTTYTIDGSLTATGTSTLSFSGPVTINNGGSAITSAANQTYNDTLTIDSDATLTNSNSSASISLAAINGSGHSLTINTAGTASISGIFTGTSNNLILNANSSTGTLTLTGANDYTGTTTITAGILRIGDGGTSGTLGTGVVTNNASLVFNLSNGTINPDGSISSSSYFGSDITGSGTVTQAGTGVIELNGNNDFSGGTTINSGGTLVMNNGNALGTGNVTVSDGGTLMLAPDATIANTITLAGTMLPYQNAAGVTLTGLLTISGANAVLGMATENVNTTNFNIGDTGKTSGGITGSGTLTSYLIIPSGTLHLYGIDNAGNFTGTLRLTANTSIELDSINNLGTSAATIEMAGGSTSINAVANQVANLTMSDSGMLQLVADAIWAGDIEINGASTTLTLQNCCSTTPTVSGAISGDGGIQLTNNGGNVIIFSNSNNTYSGTTDLNGLTLKLGAANATSPNSVILFNNGTLDLNGFDNSTQGVAGLSGNGSILLGSQTLLTNDANNNTFSGTISGTGGSLIKSGVGTFTLSGANTYTGTTTITNGTLRAGAANIFDNTSALSISSGAIFDLNSFATSIGSLTGSGNISLGTETLTVGGNNMNTTYSGIISGAGNGSTGALTKVGTGNLTLAVNNTYTGDTNINGGTLTLGSTNAIPAASTINMGVSGTLGIGVNKTIAGLTGSGNITIDSGYTLTVNNSSNNTYSGALSGAGSLTKQGAGTLTLSGSNNYTGTTSIQAGILELASSVSLGNISVASGSSLKISGVTLTTPQLSLSGSGVGGSSAALLGSGTAVLSGSISLAADSVLGTLLAADSLTISGAINGAYALSLATGVITLNSAIGATTPLTSLTSNAASTFINGASVSTSGNQTYNSAITANTALTLNAATINLNGGNITSAGTQTYNAPITLGANISLIASNNINVNNGISGAYTLALTGNTSTNNTFTLIGTLGVNSIAVTGGSGTANTLSVQSNTAQTWNISNTNAGSLSGAGSALSFTNIHSIIGDSIQTSTLSSSIANNTWDISGTNSGSVTGLTSYANMNNLTGSSGTNTFIIGNNGSISGTLNGGSTAANNTLNFASFTSPVNFTVTADNAGIVTGRIPTFSNIGNVVGNGSGTLSVSMLNQKINITSVGGYVADPIYFSNFNSFNGGSTTRIIFQTPATIISQNGTSFTAMVNGVTYTFTSTAGYSGSVTSPTVITQQQAATVYTVVNSATVTATASSIVPSTAQQPTQVFSGSASEASLQTSINLGNLINNNVTTISTTQQTEDVDTANAQQISTNCT